NVAQLGSDRRDTNSAVAHDHCGDAVPGGARDQRIPGHLGVVVGMWVDKSRRKHESVSVDGLGRSFAVVTTDCGNQTVLHRDATMKAGRARPVTNTDVFDE